MRPNNPQPSVLIKPKESILATNRVLRNTYFLLSITLIFSALTAYYGVISNAMPHPLLFLVGMFGLYYLTIALRNSSWGLLAVFAYTGFMGYMLAPMLNMYLHTYTNGGQLIVTALVATGFIFFMLSAYALITRKDFSYLGGFVAIAIMICFLLGIANIFIQMPALQLIVSGGFAVLSSAYILFITSRIIQGGERNYIMATIAIYISLFNIFITLLQILGMFAGNRR